MKQRARIGVVGAGWWATEVHIPALLCHPHAEVAALCDTDADRLRAAAARYAVEQTYTDLAAMLDEGALDGVVIVSANASHYAVAKACLEHKLHVMLEKPMTLFAGEAKELVDLARDRRRELIIGYPFNYMPYAVRSRQVVQGGELGPVQQIHVTFNSYMMPLFSGVYGGDFAVHGPRQYTQPDQTGGGHGQVQITHAAGLLFFVTGLRPRRVFALMHKQGTAVDLVDVMMVEFEGGALGTVGGSGNYQGSLFRLQVNCANGWVDMDAREGHALIHRNDDANLERAVHEKESAVRDWRYVTAHNLVDVILGAANGSPAEVGWRAVELLDAAYRSAARRGEPVRVADLYT